MAGFGGFGPAQGIIATAVVDNGTPVAGGTANGVLYVNSSGNLDSGSVFTFNGTNVTLASGAIILPDGLVGAPSLGVGEATTGLYQPATGFIDFAILGVCELRLSATTLRLASDQIFGWTNTDGTGTQDTILVRDTTGALGQRNGTNSQIFNHYGRFVSTTNFNRLAVKHNVTTVAASGATSVATGAIPAKVLIIGVSTTVTTTLTGASGYTVGDGSDADRWGDVTGTAVGTDTDYNDYTAAPIPAWNASAQDITLTAKTSNFTGGVISVDVAYLVSEAD